MSDNGTGKDLTPAGGDLTPASDTQQALRPGEWPRADVAHHLRRTDTDPRAHDRAVRQVSIMFMLSVLMVILFIVAFIVIPRDAVITLPYIGAIGALNAAMGVTFGLAILLIGLGAIHWAKKLMSDVEVVQERHEMKTDAEDTAVAADIYEVGKESSGFAKYPMIRRTMLAAMALVPIPFIVSLRDLWITPPGVTTPSEELLHTIWRPGMRLVTDITYQPVKADEIPVGGLVNVVPADLPLVEEEDHNLNARAKAAAIVIRMTPEEIQSQQGEGWDYEGILCFSKICTHVGCPISLYQQRTHELLCPCHQSTFNLADSANVVFGPAARRMPQLPITVDDEGYLVAVSDFQEPVGPSFWELKDYS
ncbi:MAG: Rieske 2Fe-2S domain-containing protein [Candidatus Nanopelagicales bacterium]